MLAWYGTRSAKDSQVTRAVEIIADDGRVEFPPAPRAQYLIHCADQCGLSRYGGYEPAPITAQELAAWAAHTGTELGAIDFQDLLDASVAYTTARARYDRNILPPPWERVLTEEEALEAREAERRYFDMLMGVKD